MKKIFFLSFVLPFHLLSAQISYTSANFASAGDTFFISNARVDSLGSTNFQLTGANYTWNYQTLIPQSQYTDKYLSAQNTGYKLSYTSACIAGGGGVAACNSSWNSLVNLGHQQLDSLNVGSFKFSNIDELYYKSTSYLPINIIGMTFGLNGINFPLTFKYTVPDTVYRFPLAYGNADSCLSSYSIDLSSLGINFRYKVSSRRVNTIEGWGALNTPYRSYSSTLKLKTLQYNYDTLFYNSSVIPVPSTTSVTYSWFDLSTKRSVLKVDGNVVQSSGVVYTGIEYIDTIRCLDPRAQFSPDPIVPYLNQSTSTASVSFNNSSQNSNQYSWNFGDTASGSLNSSSAANPSHTYSASGVYTVTLIACNAICSPLRCDTFTEPLTILDSTNTQSGFTFVPVSPCIGDTVKYTNTSLNANTYKWNFGDNTSSVLKNPKKVFAAAGTYTTQLIAIGSVKSDTSYQQITVGTTPVASVSPSGNISLCTGDSIILTASGGTYYHWSSGAVSTSITLRAAGTYTVTAYNNCGSAVSQSVIITSVSSVTPLVTVTDSPSSSICVGSNVTFQAIATNGGNSPSYQWKKNGSNVGNNTSSYASNALSNNDSVWSVLTSNASCVNTATANSSHIKITLKPNSTSTITQSICQGQSYAGHSTTNTFIDTFNAANGCDSVRTLHLTVKPNSTSTVTLSICQGQSYAGHSTTNTFIDTFNAANGCDSVRTLHLTVKPNSTSSITQSICQGQSYAGHSTTNTFIDTFNAINGCDSIRTLNLTVKPNSTSTITQSICQGQSYAGHSTTNTFIDTFNAINGCDSIRTLHLTVKPNSTSTITQSICQGQSYAGHSTTNTFIDTFNDANGCDSIRTLHLTVKPNSTSTITQSICQGQSYAGHSTTNTFIDTFNAANGCDSIRTLHLTVKTNSISTITQSICQGQSYAGHSSTNTFVDTFNAANGCDSIRTLHLTVKPNSTSTITQSICQDQSYAGYNTTGTFVDTFNAANSCDSIRTLHLTVKALPLISWTQDSFFCVDALAPVILSGASPTGGSFTGQSVSGDTLVPGVFGTYQVSYHYTDSNSCSGTPVTKTFTFTHCTGIHSVGSSLIAHLFPNPNKGSFTLETYALTQAIYVISDMLGNQISQHSISSDHQQIDLTDAASGVYTLMIRDGSSSTVLKFIIAK